MRPEFTQITTIIMYLLIQINHNILLQCHGIYIGVKKINYTFKHVIFRNYTRNHIRIWVPDGWLLRVFWCPKDAQTPCWLKLCSTPLTPWPSYWDTDEPDPRWPFFQNVSRLIFAMRYFMWIASKPQLACFWWMMIVDIFTSWAEELYRSSIGQKSYIVARLSFWLPW